MFLFERDNKIISQCLFSVTNTRGLWAIILIRSQTVILTRLKWSFVNDVSILNWMRNGKLGIKPPNSPILPYPIREDDMGTAQVTTACNEEVEAVLTTLKKRKRGEYSAYSPGTRAKIARYAINNGPAKAARHFFTVLGKKCK